MNRSLLAAVAVAMTLTGTGIVPAAEVRLREDYPDRYVVQPGDTLWDIAAQFLEDPWLWPVIWQQNAYIENPHLIYPGDVLVMVSGAEPSLRLLPRKTARAAPEVRRQPLDDAIPSIPPGIIAPFLSQPLVVGEGELEDAGHVLIGVDDNILLGRLSEFYARQVEASESGVYRVFRPGEPFIHPDTREDLGIEAIHLGDARMLRDGDVSKLEVRSSREEIEPGDRLMPADEDVGLPHYFPHAPEQDVRGYILRAPGGVSEVGPLQVVVVSLGEREGLEHGHVLRIKRHQGRIRDRLTGDWVELPDEDSGLLMIFRTFEKVSYALVTRATRSIHLLDVVVTP
jgi:hypothetical protein